MSDEAVAEFRIEADLLADESSLTINVDTKGEVKGWRQFGKGRCGFLGIGV